MARHGENIRKRKDGRWEGRYLTYSEKKEKQIYHSVYGKTYKEVKEKLIAQKDLLKNPIRQVITTSESSNISSYEIPLFQNIAQEWLTKIEISRKPSTYIKYRITYHIYIETAFYDIPISHITEQLVK